MRSNIAAVLRVAGLSLCAFNLIPVVAFAQADSYPNKPVRVVIPFSAGTPIELPARAVTQRMMETFGQSFVFDYRTGASGIIGTEAVARSEEHTSELQSH